MVDICLMFALQKRLVPDYRIQVAAGSVLISSCQVASYSRFLLIVGSDGTEKLMSPDDTTGAVSTASVHACLCWCSLICVTGSAERLRGAMMNLNVLYRVSCGQ